MVNKLSYNSNKGINLKVSGLYHKIFLRIEEFKVYIFIFAFTAIFLAVTFVNLNQVKVEVTQVGKNYRKNLTSILSNYMNEWIISRSKVIDTYSVLISNITSDANHSNDELLKMIKEMADKTNLFDVIQIYFENDKFLISNNIEITDKDELESIKNLEWYKTTKNSPHPTVTVVEKHKVLNKKTINICSTITENGKFDGIICGVIGADNVLTRIGNIDINIVRDLFLIDKNNDIIASIDNSDELPKILKNIDTNFTNLEINKNNITVSIAKTNTKEWAVGTAIDESNLISQSLDAVAKTIARVMTLFVVLVIFANALHTYLYRKIKRKKDDYELILTHKLKMIETAELIGVISHQLVQPINSTKLVLSSILQLKNEDKISKEDEIEYINLCLKSMEHLNDTVQNFKNFYKFDPLHSKFSVLGAIQSLISILHVTFANDNVSVKIKDFEDFEIVSSRNLFLQVLLVLLQNSKEAIVLEHAKYAQRQVIIEITKDNEFAYIRVCDYGGGIKEQIANKIFSTLKTSQKEEGSGIGLYFAKKIAIEKLHGDLILKNLKNPTIFELRIKI